MSQTTLQRTTIQPLDDRVLVEPEEEGDKRTAGGLYIPDTAKEKPRTGVVLAVGTDEDLQEKVRVDDRVIFSKYGGEEIDVDGRELRIIQRSDILAVVRD
jgi:chaperonin GroES